MIPLMARRTIHSTRKTLRKPVGRFSVQAPQKERLSVVTLGGGTGSFALLTGLKRYPELDLTAIISMADDGGSTGVLRDEYGVLPPGDVRQCLVALSEADRELRDLFTFRFKGGSLDGHNFGNIFLTALEQMTGNFVEGLNRVGQILKIRGAVVPVTLDKVRLITELGTGKKVEGQHNLEAFFLPSQDKVIRMRYDKAARPNPQALEAIKHADLIIVGPGSFYTSLVPIFLVPSIGRALRKAKGKKVYVANLINKFGQTEGWSVHDHVRELSRWIGTSPAGGAFDTVLYSTTKPAASFVKKYEAEGELVPLGKLPKGATYKVIGRPLLSSHVVAPREEDPLKNMRSYIRHDPAKLARALVEMVWGVTK